MDCTVDSMLTTTPFFRPRDGWLPMPMISNAPSDLISPTMATTLLVPMSRPTIRLRSERLAIGGTCGRRLGPTPADGEAVGIAHVHVRDVVQAMRNHLGRGSNEALEPRVWRGASEPYRDAAVQIHLPRSALVETQRRDAHAGLQHPALRRQVALRNLHLRAFGSGEARQFRGHVCRLPDEQLAPGIEQSRGAPARGSGLLDDGDVQTVGEAPLDPGMVHPGHPFHGALDPVEVGRHEPRLGEGRDRLLDLSLRYALKGDVHGDHVDRTVERPGERSQRSGDEQQQRSAARVAAPFAQHRGPLPARFLDLGRILEAVAAKQLLQIHFLVLAKLVSSTRHTSSSKSMPAWRAAMGTKLWSVMPGVVLISMK